MATLHARRKKGGVVEFAKRRFWRIYPPYWTAILLSAIVILLLNRAWPGFVHDGIFTVPHPDQMSRWEWLGNLTLTESWRHTVFGGEATHLLPNTWTLCYEEQFYVVAALILCFASRRIFTAAIVVTSLIFAGKTVAWSLGWDVKGSLLDGGWFLIAAGILLYYRVNFATPRQIHVIHAVLLIGIIASVLHPSRLLEFYPNHDTERFIAYSFTLLASLLYPYDHKVRGAKWLRPFWIVGGFSYSVYLCHPLIAKGISYAMYRAGWQSNSVTLFAVLPLVMVLSIAVALIYHRLVERHFIPQGSAADGAQSSRPTVTSLAPAAAS